MKKTQQDLLELLKENITLQQFVEKCSSIINLPLWIMDEYFQIVAMSKGSRIQKYADYFTKGNFNRSFSEWTESGFMQEIHKDDKPVYRYDKYIKTELVATDVRVKKKRIARLTIFLNDKKDITSDVVDLVSDALAIFIQQQDIHFSYKNSESKLLLDLIQGQSTSKYLDSALLQSKEIKISVVRSATNDLEIIQFLNSQMEKLYHSITTCILNKELVVALLDPKLDINKILDTYLNENSIRVGLSKPSIVSHNLEALYIQARLALEYGNKPFTAYEEVQTIDLLTTLSKERDLNSYFDSDVRKIYYYDKSYKTDYFETLHLLVQLDTQEEVAKKMKVHINTIKYRVRKLEELFSIQLTNKKKVRSLQVSFDIYEFLNRKK